MNIETVSDALKAKIVAQGKIQEIIQQLHDDTGLLISNAVITGIGAGNNEDGFLKINYSFQFDLKI